MRNVLQIVLICAVSFFLAPVSSHAQSVSCSGLVHHVEVEAGPLMPSSLNLLYPRVMEPNERDHDDDQNPVLTEWVVNIDGTTDYPVAHCYQTEQGMDEENFLIPPNIHRCLLDHGKFTCAAGTMACNGGWIEKVVIEKWKRGERIKEKPVVLHVKKGKMVKWAVPETNDPEVTYLARCFQREVLSRLPPYREMDDEALPKGMKLCAITEKARFICTDAPDRHDAFWPSTP